MISQDESRSESSSYSSKEVQDWVSKKNKKKHSKKVSNKETVTVCAVDMGTNSFHMVIVRADARGKSVVVVEQMKEEVRILGGTGSFNVIMDEPKARAISVLKRIQDIANTKDCDMIRLVATSAVREAMNSNAFLRHVQEATGLDVEVISGQEEARLVYLGAMQAVPIRDKNVLMLDIGGGSTEILYGKRGKAELAISLQLGHLRLFEQCMGTLDEEGRIPMEKVEECRSRIQLVLNETGINEELRELTKGPNALEIAVGCSGTIERVQAMIAANKEKIGIKLPPLEKENDARRSILGELQLPLELDPHSLAVTLNDASMNESVLEDFKFTLEELRELISTVTSCQTRKERATLPGMNVKRVDLIVTGALILEGVMDYLRLDSMTVSPFALREGVIFDSLSKSIPGFKPAPDIRRDSLMHLATRFDTENRLKSAKHSAKLAKQLVGSLRAGANPPKVLEILDERFEFLLEAGILLHSVGIFVNHAKHHKHAYYIIKNSDILLGFMPMEIEILALLALYHRKKYPNPKKAAMAKIPKDIQERIVLMTAIIRVCIALDRRNTAAAIESIQVLQDKESNSCVLVATPGVDIEGMVNDLSFEIWAVKQELEYFSSVLERDFSIVEGDRVENGDDLASNSFLSS